jgi:hypothetical protein
MGPSAMNGHASPEPGALVWRMSPWDNLVHGFRPERIGEVTAEAICSHSALTRRLTEEYGRLCQACVLLHGDELARRDSDADRFWM